MKKVGLQLTAVAIGALVLLAALACTQEVIKEVPVTEVVTQEVVREVPVEKIVEVEKETVRTVEVERPVEVSQRGGEGGAGTRRDGRRGEGGGA